LRLGPASDGDNLLGMEIDFSAYLGDPAFADEDPRLWRDMEVHRSDGAEWLITGHATGRSDSADAIAGELSRVWEERLRYRYRAEHIVTSTPGYVRLRAVTQIGPGGLWVTAEVHVELD
jgi:hypothetical protein